MIHFVYKTTNLVNDKFYIGVHSTEDINDDYLGSGKILKKAIAKYGIESFKREILFTFEMSDEAYQKEKEIVTEELVKDRNCYNTTLGGSGSFYHINNNPETKIKLSRSLKRFWENVDESFLEDFKKKTSEGTKANGEIQKLHREEWFNSLSDDRKNEIYSKVSNSLKEFWKSEKADEARSNRSKKSCEFWDSTSEEYRKKFGEPNRGYNNSDFKKSYKPLYDKLKDDFIHYVVDTQTPDYMIVKKLGGGFKFPRLLNYCAYLGEIEIVKEYEYINEHSFNRTLIKKTMCKRPNCDFIEFDKLEKCEVEYKKQYLNKFDYIVTETINNPTIPDFYILKKIGIRGIGMMEKLLSYYKLNNFIKDYSFEYIDVRLADINYDVNVDISVRRFLQKAKIIL